MEMDSSNQLNCSNGTNSTCERPKDHFGSFYSVYPMEQLITLWVLFVCVIGGNVLVLLATCSARRRKPRMTFFVINLAVADILTGLVNILSNIIWRFTGEFLASDVVCRLVKYFQVVLLYASTYVLVSLSIDRYMAIVHPMKLFKGDRYSCCLVGLAWALAFLFSAPTLFLFHKKQLGNGEMQCWSDWPDDTFWTPYMTLVAFLIYFCPLMIMCVVYFFVVRKIWMKSKMTANNQRDQTGGQTVFLHRGSIPRARVKAVKYSLLIVLGQLPSGSILELVSTLLLPLPLYSTLWIVLRLNSSPFILCWSPYFMFDILDNYKLLPDTDARDFAAIIIHNLPALNSAINPFIYCFSSPKLCQNFQFGSRILQSCPRVPIHSHCQPSQNVQVSTSPGHRTLAKAQESNNDIQSQKSSDALTPSI